MQQLSLTLAVVHARMELTSFFGKNGLPLSNRQIMPAHSRKLYVKNAEPERKIRVA